MRHLLSTLVLFAAAECHASKVVTWYGKVLEVTDGDTIIVDKRQNKIRGRVLWIDGGTVELGTIDAPELDQPGGHEAKAFLKECILGKTIVAMELLNMGRSVSARIRLKDAEDKKWLNAVMLEAGHAWAPPSPSRNEVKPAHEQAKSERQGLWAAENPISPWEWRKRSEEVTVVPREDPEPEVAPEVNEDTTSSLHTASADNPARPGTMKSDPPSTPEPVAEPPAGDSQTWLLILALVCVGGAAIVLVASRRRRDS